MSPHPTNHLERIKIKLKKDAKKAQAKERNLRRVIAEKEKDKESFDELLAAKRDLEL